MPKTNAERQRDYQRRAAAALKAAKAAPAPAIAPEPLRNAPPEPTLYNVAPAPPAATLPDLIAAFVESWPVLDDDGAPIEAAVSDPADNAATTNDLAAQAVRELCSRVFQAHADELAQSPQGAALLDIMGGRDYVHAVNQWHEHHHFPSTVPTPPIPPADLTEWNAQMTKHIEAEAVRNAKRSKASAKYQERKERQEREFKAQRAAQQAENAARIEALG